MRSRRWFTFGVLTPSMLLVSTLVAARPASAERSAEPTVAEILRTAEGVAGPAEVDVDRIPGGIEADLPGGLAEVTADEMSIDADGVPEVTLGLPTVGAGQVVGEALAADGVHEQVDVVARPTADGVQALLLIDGPSAPQRYPFPVDVGGVPAHLTLTPNGSIEIRRSASAAPVAIVEAPWATDAAGQPVPTHYDIEGDTLVQVVHHAGAAYPVVADPNVVRNCGTLTCTWYWSVAATHRLADRLLTPNGNLVYGLTSSGVCAVLAATVAGGLACGFVYAAGMYALERQLSQADRNGRCFTLSTPPRGTFGSVSRSNSRCHAR